MKVQKRTQRQGSFKRRTSLYWCRTNRREAKSSCIYDKRTKRLANLKGFDEGTIREFRRNSWSNDFTHMNLVPVFVYGGLP